MLQCGVVPSAAVPGLLRRATAKRKSSLEWVLAVGVCSWGYGGHWRALQT